MGTKKLTIGILGLLLIVALSVLWDPNLIDLIFGVSLQILNYSVNFFINLITIPEIYPFFYWLTYFSALIGVSVVMITLLWYSRARKKFSSPTKSGGLSSVNLIVFFLLLVIVIQITLSIINRELVYQVSFGLFVISIFFLAVRTLFTITTSLAYRGHPQPPITETLVSIILPAFNEEKVIAHSIHSLLQLAYTPIEIICVNDGSTDRTLSIMQKLAEKHPITVLSKTNGGKWSALNYGIQRAQGDIVVCIDADTILDPEAINPLISHFTDPKIGAVAGNIKVGNRNKLLTKLQALEYVSGLNIQRRSEAYFGNITVVPGPLGAFRVSTLKQAGMYEGDTFAEDADLTLKILKTGYKIKYEKRSIGYTEAPETVLDLGKQRYRWYRGITQSMSKHKDLLFNPKYGLNGLLTYPWMIFNNLLFSWFTFGTILWLFVLMFNPFSGFIIYQPSPGGPPISPPGKGSGGGGPGNGGPNFLSQFFLQPSPEIALQIDFFQSIPYIYIVWFVFFLLLEFGVTFYAVSADVKEKRSIVAYILLYKLVYGYIIDTVRILSQIEQYLKYPMKWESATRIG